MRRCKHKGREMHHINWGGKTYLLCYPCCEKITNRMAEIAKKVMEQKL